MTADNLEATAEGGPRAAGAPTASAATALLRASGIAKAFGPTQALRECTLEVRRGEVHAVIGENGSGKSTLVKILAGVHRPDRGRIELDGHELRALRSPRAALAAGIHAVFQEVLVVGPQSVAENVWIGADDLFRRRVPEPDKRTRAGAALGELLEHPPPLEASVELLSLSDRQACGIARALVREPKLLILDEATSALDIAARDRLFAAMRRLVEQGRSVIFISHRMDEVEQVGDRVTVLRSGSSVATVARGEASSRELARLMAGEQGQLDERARAAKAAPRVRSEVVLRTRGLKLRPGAAPIELAVRAGELVGLAGLEGHGQDAFLRALWGEPVAAGEVVRLRDGVERALHSPAQAAALGVAYVPRERRASLFPSLSIHENFAAPTAARDRRMGLLWRSRAEARLARYRERLAIKLRSAAAPITTLSGGNQQKVVIARWLAVEPRVLLLNDPTRGVDLGAKRDTYALLTELAQEGVGVVMLSTELDEHVELMDRVLVFREGELFAELGRAELSREAIVETFFGRRLGARG